MLKRREAAHAQTARITWGLLILWIGVALLAPMPEGFGFLGAGGIILASGVYHRARRWPFPLLGWISGLVLLAVGLLPLLPEVGQVSILPVALIIIGAYLIIRALRSRED